jgi:hypothetical protein
MHPASGDRRKAGMVYHFNMDQFIRSVPGEQTEHITMMRETQMFNEFIHERESTRAENPSIKLFDEIILAKRNRGRGSIFSKHNTSGVPRRLQHPTLVSLAIIVRSLVESRRNWTPRS